MPVPNAPCSSLESARGPGKRESTGARARFRSGFGGTIHELSMKPARCGSDFAQKPGTTGRALQDQAALTVLRNFPTSSLRRVLSTDSDCAADRTWGDAQPELLAPPCSLALLGSTC